MIAELAVLALLAAAVVVAVALATRPLRAPELVIDELERAFSRTGRPLPTGVTLSGLEGTGRESLARVEGTCRLTVSAGLGTGENIA